MCHFSCSLEEIFQTSVSFNLDGCVMGMMIASMDQMNQTNRPLQITAGLGEYVVRAQQDILLSESD